MNPLAREQLIAVVQQHGPVLASDPRRLRSLLADRCPECKKEIAVLATAAELKVAEQIRTSTGGTPWPVIAGRMVEALADGVAMHEAAARWAVDSWALALGRITTAPPYVETKSIIQPRITLDDTPSTIAAIVPSPKVVASAPALRSSPPPAPAPAGMSGCMFTILIMVLIVIIIVLAYFEQEMRHFP